MSEEKIDVKVEGKYWDVLIYKDGTVVETPVRKNLVVDKFGPLVMALLAGEAGFSGIQYHAIGTGTTSPAAGDVALETEVSRKAPTYIHYLDSSDEITTTPTKKIVIRTDFLEEDDANGSSITEQGLFGGNATTTADSGYMIDRMTHDAIYKTSDFRLQRFITLEMT